MKTNEQIFSSTGELGASWRQFNRFYFNWDQTPIQEVDRLAGVFVGARMMSEARLGSEGRMVFRGLVEDNVARDIFSGHQLFEHLEVAVPIQQGESGRNWLVVLSRNGEKRKTPHTPVSTIVQETSNYTVRPERVDVKVRRKLDEGYRFVSEISPQIQDQLLDLWGDTFGWSEAEIAAMSHRLEGEKSISAENRSVWFTGVMNGEELVAASMAERLDVPTEGGYIRLVESTEWKTKPGYTKRGLITAAVAVTNAQVLHDLGREDIMLFAECNFATRSDFVANGAGMQVPQREYTLTDSGESITIPQVLVQNVGVNDGLHLGEGEDELRDFTLFYLPQDSMEKNYGEESVRSIIYNLNS